MKSFADWTQELAESVGEVKHHWEKEDALEPRWQAYSGTLPEGVYLIHERPDVYGARCVYCDNITEIYCDLSEFEESNHYCGGSPRCCP